MSPEKKKLGRKRPGRRTPGSGKYSAQEIKLNERRAKAIEMRLQGWSFPQIATALKVGYSTAVQDVKISMQEIAMPGVEEYREITLQRLEALLTGYMPNALNGDEAALSSTLRIIGDMRKITGMDAPLRVSSDVTGEIGHHHGGAIQHNGVIQIELVPAPVRAIEGTLANGNGTGH